MKKIRLGVFGTQRGDAIINCCRCMDNVKVVALCDKNDVVMEIPKQKLEDAGIALYHNFDDFIRHDMDAVILVNYANEHAPFAIKAMKAGKHVFSEVLPVQTMAEAVELIETVEETGMIYAYDENYCYLRNLYEMRRLYRQGEIGELEYAEGEYLHNCEEMWPVLTKGDPNHWRNNMYSTYYCTHSLGPIIHITGLRPVRVTGFETSKNARGMRVGRKGSLLGIEMVELENGALVKSIHGELYKDSNWHCVYGSKGRMETSRKDSEDIEKNKIFINVDEYPGQYGETNIRTYRTRREFDDRIDGTDISNMDYYSLYHFVQKILGNPEADVIDVYEAMDMCLPGIFAYRSILAGNVPMDIPNLRNKDEREKWRNDTACNDPEIAGDMLLPTYSRGEMEIDPGIYEYIKKLYEEAEHEED